MAHKPEKLLADIIAAVEAINRFTAGHTRLDYGLDLLLRSAVERQLEILGEAIRRLEILDLSLAAQISEYRRIIGLRNILAHGYDGVDDDVVWQVIEIKLPILLAEARTLMTGISPTL
jgi:uncharacterized protein with HEPN domain